MIPIGVFANLRSLLKGKQEVDINSIIFKLQYRVTTTVLLCFCLLITTNSLVGNPISCLYDTTIAYLKEDTVNTYCWVHSTYTLSKYYSYPHKGGIAHPGVGTHNNSEDDKIYHTYYQWVPFILFFQALMFYTPHWLWKAWEGGKLQSAVAGLSIPIKNNNERQKAAVELVEYLHVSHRQHNYYTIRYLFCEILSLINCVLNIVLLNSFLNEMFFDYGNDVLAYYRGNINSTKTTTNNNNPMTIMFPKVTKCSFPMYGPSGSMEIQDLLCVLALNNFNDKIFLFLWFWLIFLSVVNTVGFLYHVLIFIIPDIRKLYLKRISKVKDWKIINFFDQSGDSFLLYLIKKNIDTLTFNCLLDNLSQKLNSFDAKSHSSKDKMEKNI
uniref:Innexin n=1 Tax=Metapenaeus joyneri majanivirus TaxID=2984280 RepID=A0A9C7F855_9VIRU|nr:MAG: innexin [Metapenaeus joyneri majanivirus]